MGLVADLVKGLGGGFAVQLGIDLSSRSEAALFKWWLASLLFGARIGEAIAVRSFKMLEAAGLDSPSRVLEQGWNRLVALLDQGGYVRYDFKTADKLLAVSRRLIDDYQGSLNQLHDAAQGSRDLEARLKALGKGVGDVTVAIFLRELRSIWPKADPSPGGLAVQAGQNLGIESIKGFWRLHSEGVSLSDFESALVRLAKDYCRKSRCLKCPVFNRCRGKGRP